MDYSPGINLFGGRWPPQNFEFYCGEKVDFFSLSKCHLKLK